jgi:hypothetical protein
MLSARTIYGEIFDHDEAFGLFRGPPGAGRDGRLRDSCLAGGC